MIIIPEWFIILCALFACAGLVFYYSRRGDRSMRIVWMWLLVPCGNTIYTYYRIAGEQLTGDPARFLARLNFVDFLITITAITVILGLTNVKRSAE